MKTKLFLRKLSVYLTHMLYKYDKSVEKLIKQVIADVNCGEAFITDINHFEIVITYPNKTIELWNTNRWYSFLSRAKYRHARYFFGNTIYDRLRPSRKTMCKMIDIITEMEPHFDLSESGLHSRFQSFYNH